MRMDGDGAKQKWGRPGGKKTDVCRRRSSKKRKEDENEKMGFQRGTCGD